MSGTRMVIAALTALLLLFGAGAASADDALKGVTVKKILTDSIGKKVALRVDSHDELEGTVAAVGDQVVQISKLSGRDYFDAYVNIDRIIAVVVRTR